MVRMASFFSIKPIGLFATYLGVLVFAMSVAGCGSAETHDIASCQAAIKKARDMAGVVSDSFGEAAKYPPMIYEAAQAGANTDTARIDQIASRMNKVTKSIDRRADRLGVLAEEFNSAAEECK